MSEESNTTLHLEGDLPGDEAALKLDRFLEPDTSELGKRIITVSDTSYERYAPMALLDAPTNAISARICAFCVAWRADDMKPYPVILSFEATEAPISETLQVRALED
jgi:hypothetical protein